MTEIKIDQTLDLKNTPCPVNFVKTKLKLEEMQQGQTLLIFLDDGDSIVNVTGSVKEEGHQILKAEKISNHWNLLIRKI